MKENKRKFALWMRPDAFDLVETHYKRDDCRSRSEFIEKAVHFYTGYIGSKDYKYFLPRCIVSTVQATVHVGESRQVFWMYRLTLELSMLAHLLGETLNLEDEDYKELIEICQKEVNSLVGASHFEYILDQLHFHDQDVDEYY